MEIESPGKLPNSVSIESVRVGAKYYRNQVLVQYLKESGFMDLHSLGIPVKILKLCKEYSGIEPKLEELGNSFKVTLYPKRKQTITTIEKQILELLRIEGKALKSRAIGEKLGLSKRTVINRLNQLIQKNLVEATTENRNHPNCKYRIKI